MLPPWRRPAVAGLVCPTTFGRIRQPHGNRALDVGWRKPFPRRPLEQRGQFGVRRKPQRRHLLDRQLFELPLLFRCQQSCAADAHFEPDDPVLQLGRIGAADEQQRQHCRRERKQPHGKGCPAADVRPPHREGRERHDEEESSDGGKCRPVHVVRVGLCCHTPSIRPRCCPASPARPRSRSSRLDDAQRRPVR